ncbi:MAG TPA: MarC family protein [Bdellovibrio sp.]|nr:MarC family protein [Bdellovibrio sp.]
MEGMLEEYIVIFFKDLLVVIAGLVPIINPMGQMPIFLSLTQDIRKEDRKVLAKKIATYGFFLLLVSMLIGTYVLKFFGISLSAVQIGGGLLVVKTGWSLLEADDSGESKKVSIEGPELLQAAYARRAFYPLTFPLTVGPGSVSVAITLGVNSRAEGHVEIVSLIATTLGLFIVSGIVFLCFRFADRLVAKLGEIGTVVILRMSAFILLCLGIQIIWNGLSELIPHLFKT